MVEGVFARAFRSGLRPVELGRRLVREMDDNRTVDVRGRTVVPNHFEVELSGTDFEQFAEIHDTLTRELADAARDYARDEGYTFLGPVTVELVQDDGMHTGAFQIAASCAKVKAAPGPGRSSSPPVSGSR